MLSELLGNVNRLEKNTSINNENKYICIQCDKNDSLVLKKCVHLSDSI